ncbi:NAD(P)-binding domain-containing protein [Chryseobacterium sp. RP-3-3]|uniref:NAD(P)-binding domain-containing protein n=1 Tax=Chryseobacterium antibioticum TaxID=2728847 RepID=A0A7Y0AKH0_9FLAO|nr:NAD(P)-binding domain-containing protein [Chryseobacterium antibioticum]NML68966.1 NAD(P)-binding domain-containing protein [Chryseobacterium antibioticum]
MKETKKKYAIIGAGFSGLAMANELKKSAIDFVVYDSNPQIGGNWYNIVYESGHTITPKKVMEFPDFKMPENFPVFPSKKQIQDYLLDFVKQKGLEENIVLNTGIQMIQNLPEDQWLIQFKDGSKKEFAGIILAIGLFRIPVIPNYEGTFTGEILHSSAYKTPEILKGKNVLVVGAGNSGVDIVVESGLNAQTTDVSLKDTPWIIPKMFKKKPITDYLGMNVPLWLKKRIIKHTHNVIFGDIRDYGLPKPKHELFTKPPTVNESFIHSMKHGKFAIKPEIKGFEGKNVLFVDGTSKEYDLIIFATGYRPSYQIVEPGVIPIEENRPALVHGVFTPLAKEFYVIGSGVPNNGIGPIVFTNAKLILKAIQLQQKEPKPVGVLYAGLGERTNPLRTTPKACIKRFRKLIEKTDSLIASQKN